MQAGFALIRSTMLRQKTLLAAAIAMVAIACTTIQPPPPVDARAPIGPLPADPRLGYPGPEDASRRRILDTALAELARGERTRAVRRLEDLASGAAPYEPAALTLGALALADADLERAEEHIRAAATRESWAAAEFYRAELAYRRGSLREALELFQRVEPPPRGPALAGERIESIRTRLFDELYANALAADAESAVAGLRDALRYRPDSSAARLLLAQKLIAVGRLAEARMELDPLLAGKGADSVEVQQALAEIDAGRGRYEDAIARYEEIVQRDARPEYARRLESIKRDFAVANMPPQYRAAAASLALTRVEFAILAYWTVSPVRFGRPSGSPPVAVDIGNIAGREELVKAIAFGILPVDHATRRADPDRVMTGANVGRFLHRILNIRGVPSCAAGSAGDPLDALAGCGIEVSALRALPSEPVTGTDVLRALQKIDAILSSE